MTPEVSASFRPTTSGRAQGSTLPTLLVECSFGAEAPLGSPLTVWPVLSARAVHARDRRRPHSRPTTPADEAGGDRRPPDWRLKALRSARRADSQAHHLGQIPSIGKQFRPGFQSGCFFGFFRVFGFFRPPRFPFFSGGLDGGLAFISWFCGRVTRTPGLVRVASTGSTRCRWRGASGIRLPRRRGRVGRLGSDAAATEPPPPGDHFASGSRGPRRFPPAARLS